MKFTALLAACLALPTAAQMDCSNCPVGTFCTNSVMQCRSPPLSGECFNATLNDFQQGCASGFDCFDNQCECVIDDTVPTPSPSPVVYSTCPSGTYWALGGTACRGPSYAGECFNPATAMFQDGCAPGFSCQNNKCNTIPPATFSPNVCYVKCATSDQYCENGTTECRGPNFQGECFNPATGYFQNGCDPGFTCANNLCVKA